MNGAKVVLETKMAENFTKLMKRHQTTQLRSSEKHGVGWSGGRLRHMLSKLLRPKRQRENLAITEKRHYLQRKNNNYSRLFIRNHARNYKIK